MLNLQNVQDEFSDDIEAVSDWCEEIYQNNFASHFSESRELFLRLKSKTQPITDEELSWILINLPLNLFDVSEVLNKFKVNQEVVKLRNKQKESDLVKASIETTATKRQEEASIKMLENKLLVTAYSSVMSRVESEISFCRELIMGAKKIWDARRRSESANPVGLVTDDSHTDLPDYQQDVYIKGGK